MSHRMILRDPTDPDGKSRRKAAMAVRTDATGGNLKVLRPTYLHGLHGLTCVARPARLQYVRSVVGTISVK